MFHWKSTGMKNAKIHGNWKIGEVNIKRDDIFLIYLLAGFFSFHLNEWMSFNLIDVEIPLFCAVNFFPNVKNVENMKNSLEKKTEKSVWNCHSHIESTAINNNALNALNTHLLLLLMVFSFCWVFFRSKSTWMLVNKSYWSVLIEIDSSGYKQKHISQCPISRAHLHTYVFSEAMCYIWRAYIEYLHKIYDPFLLENKRSNNIQLKYHFDITTWICTLN